MLVSLLTETEPLLFLLLLVLLQSRFILLLRLELSHITNMYIEQFCVFVVVFFCFLRSVKPSFHLGYWRLGNGEKG